MYVYIFHMFTAFHLFPGIVVVSWRKKKVFVLSKANTFKKLKLKMRVEEK